MRFAHRVMLAAGLALALTTPAFAQQAPDLQTTSALVQAGGGSNAFSGQALMKFLAGTKSQYESEIAGLNDKFGAQKVASFVDVFTFIFTDGVKRVQSNGVAALPSPNPDTVSDPESLAEVFYKAGMTDEGFSVAQLFDKLFGHDVHAALVKAIGVKFGGAANANFETILAQTMSDMKAGYDL